MRTKKKIIQEQKEQIEQLELRLTQQAGVTEQLQRVVENYRGREKAVTDAMTEVAAMRARITGEAQKQAEQILSEADSTRTGAEAEAQEMISTAYQSARDIVKGAEAERKQKLEQTEAAINTYAEILRQYNEIMKEQVKQAEENARQYAAYYRQLAVAIPELLGDTQGLADAPDEELPMDEIDNDPAKLMRNIYTIEHRSIPDAEVPDRTSADGDVLPAQDAPDEQTLPEDEQEPPRDAETQDAEESDNKEDNGAANGGEAGREKADGAANGGEAGHEKADSAAHTDDDAEGEDGMPPVVSDLIKGGEDEVAELDKLLDDIINAAE